MGGILHAMLGKCIVGSLYAGKEGYPLHLSVSDQAYSF